MTTYLLVFSGHGSTGSDLARERWEGNYCP